MGGSFGPSPISFRKECGFNCAGQAHPWLTSSQNEWGGASWLTEIQVGPTFVPMLRKPL
jgi:hypothetical protein